MEDEGRNRDYEHITKYFTLKFPHTPDEIGYCLGINSFIGNDSILILSKKYKEKNFDFVLLISQQILIKALILSFNERPQIIKELSFSNFPFLQVLDLSCNEIQTIQGLKKVDLRCVKLLNLEGNKISKINGLIQSHIPALQNLSIKANKYYEYSGLSCLSCSNLQVIELNEIPPKRKVIKFISIQVQLVFS